MWQILCTQVWCMHILLRAHSGARAAHLWNIALKVAFWRSLHSTCSWVTHTIFGALTHVLRCWRLACVTVTSISTLTAHFRFSIFPFRKQADYSFIFLFYYFRVAKQLNIRNLWFWFLQVLKTPWWSKVDILDRTDDIDGNFVASIKREIHLITFITIR